MWWKVGKNIYLCNRILYKDVRMRFLGNIEAKTDAKGRAFLPAIFRKVLQAAGEENLVLRKDVSRNVWYYIQRAYGMSALTC